MARNRMIRPEFWSDEKIGSLSFMERLLFIGMWNFADDEGLIKANAVYLKGRIFPYDNIETEEIVEALNRFEKLKMIYTYGKNNQKYAWIIKFRVYQRIDKPQNPQHPLPRSENYQSYGEAIYYRDGFICHLCGCETDHKAKKTLPNSNAPSIDHIIPKSKGGDDRPSNLKTACITCNRARGNAEIKKALAKTHGKIAERSKNAPGTLPPKRKEVKRKEVKRKEVKRNRCNSPADPPGPSPGEAGPGDDHAVLKAFLKEHAEPSCPDCKGEGWSYKHSEILKKDVAVQCKCTGDAAMTAEDIKRIREKLKNEAANQKGT